VFAEIIAAAADYEQSNRTHLRWERQPGYAAAQNQGICAQVPCCGRPSVNREYSAALYVPQTPAGSPGRR
jgi:hypothetical protein